MEISHSTPNVFYEVGYATAKGKPILFLAMESVTLPANLLGADLIRYSEDRDGWVSLEHKLKRHLQAHVDSSVSLLRSMLLPLDAGASYRIVNPKLPTADSHFRTHPLERRTYGDYLGMVGILRVFASVWGEHVTPEVLSAEHVDPSLPTWDANLYLIGSVKVNKFTGHFLSVLQDGRTNQWLFRPAIGFESGPDPPYELNGFLKSGLFSWSFRNGTSDYGLVMRGPHPNFPNRLVVILAGPRSLGTAAACLAATNSSLIRSIGERLGGAQQLSVRSRTIWALVKGEPDAENHILPENVGIVEAGYWEQTRVAAAIADAS